MSFTGAGWVSGLRGAPEKGSELLGRELITGVTGGVSYFRNLPFLVALQADTRLCWRGPCPLQAPAGLLAT